MIGRVLLLTALTAPAQAAAPPALSVMTWNVCASHNKDCFFYGRSTQELAWKVGWYAVNQPIRPDVILLQEFCSGGTATLEKWLETKTRRAWTVRSAVIDSADGTPKQCARDSRGRSRGSFSIAVAVAGNATFDTHALTSPPWYQRRVALCATIPASRARVCGTHLSAGLSYDDKQNGAPYRTRQVRELLAVAAKPGYRVVIGGDLNARPPDSGQGSVAERNVTAPLYAAYQECDQRGAARNGRWTERHGSARIKLDYLFAPKGRVAGCYVEQRAASSDHKPLYVKVS
ncbi:MAG: endonuclease/exonuclease/phosphatase family protein [Nonomuraea sp.]|nr:endonuclease/exonuclease/phosphatase family protein [Nonomuraea sp.]